MFCLDRAVIDIENSKPKETTIDTWKSDKWKRICLTIVLIFMITIIRMLK